MLCHTARGASALPSIQPCLGSRSEQSPKCMTKNGGLICTYSIHREWIPCLALSCINERKVYSKWHCYRTKNSHSHSFLASFCLSLNSVFNLATSLWRSFLVCLNRPSTKRTSKCTKSGARTSAIRRRYVHSRIVNAWRRLTSE